MINLFKGFIIGIGKIIPGVSGAMLAISMGVYDTSINYILGFKDKKKDAFKYLFPLGVGIIFSIVVFSKIISILMVKYYVVTMLFFIGLIIGGIPSIINKSNFKKNYYIFFISFIIMLMLSINNINNSYILKGNIVDMFLFFLSGIIEIIGTIVPGISSTALLMIIGSYDIIIKSLGNLCNIYYVIIPFCLGIISGFIALIKIVNYLFNKYKDKMYSFILGVLSSSIVLLMLETFKYKISIISLLFGILSLVIGLIIGNFFDR